MKKYIAPTPEEIKEFLSSNSLTQSKSADIAGLAGSRSIRKYLGGKEVRVMSYAVWFTLHAKTLLTQKELTRIEASMQLPQKLVSLREQLDEILSNPVICSDSSADEVGTLWIAWDDDFNIKGSVGKTYGNSYKLNPNELYIPVNLDLQYMNYRDSYYDPKTGDSINDDNIEKWIEDNSVIVDRQNKEIEENEWIPHADELVDKIIQYIIKGDL